MNTHRYRRASGLFLLAPLLAGIAFGGWRGARAFSQETEPTGSNSREVVESQPIPSDESSDPISAQLGLVPEDNPDFDNEAEMTVFEQAIEAWRETISDMREEMIRFSNGTPEVAEEHKSRYRELEAVGRGHFDTAFASARRLLENAPRQNLGAAQFLLFAVHYRFDRDWYEGTGEVAEILLGVQAEDEGLYEIAGVSLAVTGHHERAEPYLKKALESGKVKDHNYPFLDQLAEVKRLWEQEQDFVEADLQRGNLPQVRFTTTKGDIVVELFEDVAPNTVANFIDLVDSGYYDELPFYQVISGRIALVGDISGDGSGNAGFGLADECIGEDSRPFVRGSLAMAKLPDVRSDNQGKTLPDTASSQFFMGLQPMPLVHLEHTVFGRVVTGLDTLSVLNRVDPSKKKDEAAAEKIPDRLLSAVVIRRRDHPYVPKRIERPPLEIAAEILGLGDSEGASGEEGEGQSGRQSEPTTGESSDR